MDEDGPQLKPRRADTDWGGGGGGEGEGERGGGR